MIYLDTDRLQQMVGTLEAANHRIDEATDILMRITTHDDWGCAERHQINDYILKNKNMIQQLQSISGGFYNIMKQVAAEFIETESNIGNLFSDLENVLGKTLSVVVNSVGGAVTTGTIVENAGNLAHSIANVLVPICQLPAVWSPIQITDLFQEWEVSNMQDVWEQIGEEPYHTGHSQSNPLGTSIWMEEGISIFNLKDFDV